MSPEQWTAALEANGWKKYRGSMTTWVAPNGLLFRGPWQAYDIMQRAKASGIDMTKPLEVDL